MNYDPATIEKAKQVYRKYIGIKNFFHGKYNYFKYSEKVANHTSNNLENKPDIHACVSLCNEFRNMLKIEQVLVLNIKEDRKWWIGLREDNGSSKLFKKRTYKKYKDFLAFVDSSLYIFSKQVKPIFTDPEYSYSKYFESSKEHKHSLIFEMYEQGKINEEVLIILNLIFDNFLEKDIFKNHNDFIFEPIFFKIVKYSIFLEKWNIFDILKYENIIKNFLSLNNNKILEK